MQPSSNSEDNDDLSICAALITTHKKHHPWASTFLFCNFLHSKGCLKSTFSLLTPEQAKHIKPKKPAPLRQLRYNNHDFAIQLVN